MIEAKELRIGNYLNLDGVIKQISTIHYDDTVRFYDSEKGSIGCYSLKNKSIQPIQLTEDILLRLGFVWNENTLTFEHTNRKLANWHVSKSVHISVQNWQVFNYVLKAVVNGKVKYLHQLQNLYCALTGEELTLKN